MWGKSRGSLGGFTASEWVGMLMLFPTRRTEKNYRNRNLTRRKRHLWITGVWSLAMRAEAGVNVLETKTCDLLTGRLKTNSGESSDPRKFCGAHLKLAYVSHISLLLFHTDVDTSPFTVCLCNLTTTDFINTYFVHTVFLLIEVYLHLKLFFIFSEHNLTLSF